MTIWANHKSKINSKNNGDKCFDESSGFHLLSCIFYIFLWRFEQMTVKHDPTETIFFETLTWFSLKFNF